MSKQEEIKQALAAATPGPWLLEEAWNDNPMMVMRPDGKIPIAELAFKNFENDANLIANAPEYIAYLLEEVEKWKKLADAKVVFASNGNDDYQYGLQEEVIRLAKELEKSCRALNAIQMGEWACTHDEQGLEVWTTRRINPGQIARDALNEEEQS